MLHASMPGISGSWEYPYSLPTVFAGRIDDARVFSASGIACTPDSSLIFAGLTGSDQAPREIAQGWIGDPSGAAIMSAAEKAAPIVADECVYLGGGANFGHFVFEDLMKLYVISLIPGLASLPLVVFDDVPMRFLGFLTLLGYPLSRLRIVPRRDAVRARRVWLASAPLTRDDPTTVPRILPDAVLDLRRRFRTARSNAGAPQRRVFLGREQARWRRIVNRQDYFPVLQRLGIEPLALHQLEAAAQIEALARAELIVVEQGADGAATLFAPDDCAIVEIASPHLVAAFGTLGFAAITGQPFARVVGRSASPAEVAASGLPPNPSTAPLDSDYVVEVAAVERALAVADAYCQSRPKAAAI